MIMENMDAIVQVIATLGFPAAMCILMFYFLNKEQENHKAEMLELKGVISQNNEVLASLKQLIEDKLQ
jgi:preprotein translocase subunit YajC